MRTQTINHLIYWRIICLILTFSMINVSCNTTQTQMPNEILESKSPTKTESNPTTNSTLKVPTKTNLMPSKTPKPTITPTSSQATLRSDLRLAYTIYQPEDGNHRREVKIYLWEPNNPAPLEFYKYYPEGGFDAHLAWSHNGNFLAFGQTYRDIPMITILDITKPTKKEIFIPIDISVNEINSVIHWSNNDQWIALSIQMLNDRDRVKSFILDTQNEMIWELSAGVEFVSWSSVIQDQYLYIQHNYFEVRNPEEQNEGVSSVNLGQVGEQKPVQTINFGGFFPQRSALVSWAPDSERAILIINDGDTSVIDADLKNNRWEKLFTLPKSDSAFFGPWSPDGRWIVMYVDNIAYLWEVYQSDPSELLEIPSATTGIMPGVWLYDSSQMIYQDGNNLYAVYPEHPQSPIPVLDLGALGIAGDPQIYVKLWIPPFLP